MSVVIVRTFDLLSLDHKSIEFRVTSCESGCVKAMRSARTGKPLGRGKIQFVIMEENDELLKHTMNISRDMQGGVLCVDTRLFPLVRCWVSHERLHIEASKSGLESGLHRESQIPVVHLSS